MTPPSAEAYHVRKFEAARRQKMNSQSIAYFDEAIALLQPDDPTLVTAHHNRGFAYYRQGDYDRALEDYTKALELSPDDAEVYFDRGIASFP